MSKTEDIANWQRAILSILTLNDAQRESRSTNIRIWLEIDIRQIDLAKRNYFDNGV